MGVGDASCSMRMHASGVQGGAPPVGRQPALKASAARASRRRPRDPFNTRQAAFVAQGLLAPRLWEVVPWRHNQLDHRSRAGKGGWHAPVPPKAAAKHGEVLRSRLLSSARAHVEPLHCDRSPLRRIRQVHCTCRGPHGVGASGSRGGGRDSGFARVPVRRGLALGRLVWPLLCTGVPDFATRRPLGARLFTQHTRYDRLAAPAPPHRSNTRRRTRTAASRWWCHPGCPFSQKQLWAPVNAPNVWPFDMAGTVKKKYHAKPKGAPGDLHQVQVARIRPAVGPGEGALSERMLALAPAQVTGRNSQTGGSEHMSPPSRGPPRRK